MEPKEIERTLIIAASLCITVAFTDLIINQIKRSNARKRAEAIPQNVPAINRRPQYEDVPQAPPQTQEPVEKDNADVSEETTPVPDAPST